MIQSSIGKGQQAIPQQWLSQGEIARETGYSTRTVRQWIAGWMIDGLVTGYIGSGSYKRYRRSEIEAGLAASMRSEPEEPVRVGRPRGRRNGVPHEPVQTLRQA